MASGSAGPLDHLPGVVSPRRKSHGHDRLWPSLTSPSSAALLVLMVPVPSDRDRAGLVGTLLLTLPPLPGVPSATTVDLNALGTAAESQLGDSATRSLHAEWAREQQAEPACHASTLYIISRPRFLLPHVLSYFPSHLRPSFSEIPKLAGKDRLHTTDGAIVLLVRQLDSAPAVWLAGSGGTRGFFYERRAYSHLCAVAHAALGHAGSPFDGFLPLGTRAPCECSDISAGGGLKLCIRWWLRDYLKCQAQKPRCWRSFGPISPWPCQKGPALPLRSITLAPLPSRLQPIPTSCSSPIFSVVRRILCSQCSRVHS